jgi:hypothetical protein
MTNSTAGLSVNVSVNDNGDYKFHHHSSMLIEKVDSISNVNNALAIFAIIGVCFTATIGTYSSNAAVKYAPASLTSVAQNSDLPVSITENEKKQRETQGFF